MWACGQVEPEAAGTDAGPGRGTGASRGHSRTTPNRLPAPESAVRPNSAQPRGASNSSLRSARLPRFPSGVVLENVCR